MSHSSDSSFTHTINCNVFLSFLGQDTRRTFVSHLLGLLKRRGFTTTELKNDPSSGKSDSSDIHRAISESEVAVVVISENFATSPRCVESVNKILKFLESGSLRKLIPVFYKMDPRDVKILTQHRWRQELCKLVDIPGTHYSEDWKSDADLIARIADDIWDFLIGSKSVDFCGLVGMDRHMEAMYKLLDLRRKEEVRWILISGSKGIGKTELAKYLYEEILHHFDTHVSVADKNIGAYFKLREILASDHRGSVLFVLDGVYGGLYGYEHISASLGPGSRVITTSVLGMKSRSFTRRGYHEEILFYTVEGLELPQALQLFCLHAFGQTGPSNGFEELSSRALTLAGGNPSIIKKLGSILSGRDRDEWEAKLNEYKNLYHGLWRDSTHSSLIDSVSNESSTENDSYDLVGMDRHMQAVSGLLNIGSNKEVRVIGISGAGGIGKTTLARYAYEEISPQFHTHVFLENAEDQSSTVSLEDQFLSKTIQRENFAIRNSKDGLAVTKSGLRNQKVLLIVDGVDNTHALNEVQQMASWFYPGSRVILTSRDESLLLTNGVKYVYEVKCTFGEALQIFYQFALKEKSPSYCFQELSIRAIKLVGYLPLALKVTGSMLNGKDQKYWETILQRFEAKQDKGKYQEVKTKKVSVKEPWWRR